MDSHTEVADAITTLCRKCHFRRPWGCHLQVSQLPWESSECRSWSHSWSKRYSTESSFKFNQGRGIKIPCDSDFLDKLFFWLFSCHGKCKSDHTSLWGIRSRRVEWYWRHCKEGCISRLVVKRSTISHFFIKHSYRWWLFRDNRSTFVSSIIISLWLSLHCRAGGRGCPSRSSLYPGVASQLLRLGYSVGNFWLFCKLHRWFDFLHIYDPAVEFSMNDWRICSTRDQLTNNLKSFFLWMNREQTVVTLVSKWWQRHFSDQKR